MTELQQVNNSSEKSLKHLVRRFFDEETIIILSVFIMLGIAMTMKSGFVLKSDGPNYFVYLRSVFFDFDLDFRNEYFNFDKAFWDTYRPKFTSTGYYTNVFSVGPAILWAPFYSAVHLFVLLANNLGYHFTPDGFSTPYIYGVNLANVFYGFLGTVLVYKTCTKYFSRSASLISAITLLLSTFILYYIINQPYMSHSASYFSVTLFFYYWDSTRTERKSYQWMLLGLLSGLMMMVRWQNGLYMILPAIESLIFYWENTSHRDWTSVLTIFKNNLIFLLCAALGFFPQMLAWKIIYGGYLTIPQGGSFLRWSTPFVTEVLFSSRHGLLSWSPIVYFSLIGWLLFFKRDKLVFWGSTVAFMMMLYLNSIVLDWWAGWGFGMRRFDGSILFFAIGFAAFFSLLEKARLYIFLPTTVIILSFFMGFNFHLMNLVDTTIHPGGTVSFETVLGLAKNNIDAEKTGLKSSYTELLAADTTTHSNAEKEGWYHRTGYPFSFPANTVFALRFGEPASRFDTLVGGYIDDPSFYGNTIQMEKSSPLLGEGWTEPRAFDGISWRAMEESSIIYAPLLTVNNYTMIFRAKAVTDSKEPLTIFLNETKLVSVFFISKWYDYSIALPKELLKPGINVIKFVNKTGATASFETISFYSKDPVPNWK